jgi:hypothetical protein
VGYDERRYVSLWGTLTPSNGHLQLEPERVQHWDEQEMSFFEYSERGVPQATRYMERVSRETGQAVKPKLSRSGSSSGHAAPVPFGHDHPHRPGHRRAGFHGQWHWWYAVLTLIAGRASPGAEHRERQCSTRRAAPTRRTSRRRSFSGGSRVIHYGLLSMRQMELMSLAFYAVGLGIGIYLAIATAFWMLLAIGVLGAAVSYFYTAPPLRLVHRGLGEIGYSWASARS